MQTTQSGGEEDVAVLREALAFIGDFGFDDEWDFTTDLLGDAPDAADACRGSCDVDNVLLEAGIPRSPSSIPLVTSTTLTTAARPTRVPSRRSRPHSSIKRRDELQCMRDRVKELEHRLGVLQKRTNGQPAGGVVALALRTGKRPTPIVVEAWERVAQRQYEQRRRAETENSQLKRLLQDQIEVGKALGTLLTRKRPRGTETLHLLAEHRAVPASVYGKPSTRQIFANLFASIDRQYPETTRRMAKIQHADPAENHHDVRLVHDADAGLVLQTSECRIFPFEYEATVEELWNVVPDITAHGTHHVDRDDNQRTIQLRIDVMVGSSHAVLDIYIASRRYIEAERTVSVSSALIDPHEILDMNMDGIQMRQQGWSIIEPLRPTPTDGLGETGEEHATRMTFYAIASPIVNGTGVEDPNRKTGALTNFVMTALSFNKALRHQTLENRLVERSVGVAR